MTLDGMHTLSRSYRPPQGLVFGFVWLWGLICDDDDGSYRSEWAYPAALLATIAAEPPLLVDAQVRAIACSYNVPVLRWEHRTHDTAELRRIADEIRRLKTVWSQEQ
jgi:hypothetical protein